MTMYATDGEQPKEHVGAFDTGSGKELWTTVVGDRFDEQFGDGPRSTPFITGESVIALGSLGDLICLALDDGSERWRVPVEINYKGKNTKFNGRPGYSVALVLSDDAVYLAAGNALKAYELSDGSVRWNGPTHLTRASRAARLLARELMRTIRAWSCSEARTLAPSTASASWSAGIGELRN